MLAQLCKGILIFFILCSRTSKTCFFKLNTAVKPNFKMETSSSTLFILSVFIFNYLPVNKHTLQKTRDNIPRAEHFISCFHSNHGYQHLTNNLTPSHLKYLFLFRKRNQKRCHCSAIPIHETTLDSIVFVSTANVRISHIH